MCHVNSKLIINLIRVPFHERKKFMGKFRPKGNTSQYFFQPLLFSLAKQIHTGRVSSALYSLLSQFYILFKRESLNVSPCESSEIWKSTRNTHSSVFFAAVQYQSTLYICTRERRKRKVKILRVGLSLYVLLFLEKQIRLSAQGFDAYRWDCLARWKWELASCLIHFYCLWCATRGARGWIYRAHWEYSRVTRYLLRAFSHQKHRLWQGGWKQEISPLTGAGQIHQNIAWPQQFFIRKYNKDGVNSLSAAGLIDFAAPTARLFFLLQCTLRRTLVRFSRDDISASSPNMNFSILRKAIK